MDIDGVLNTEDWWRRRAEFLDQYDWPSVYPFCEFDPVCVQNLNRLVKETDAKVVISSSWRILHNLENLREILKKVGFTGEIIDVTPHMWEGTGLGYGIPRGCEIDWWLERKGKFKRINWNLDVQKEYIEKSIVKNYIILDDDGDMLLEQMEHHVKCHRGPGLDEKTTDLSIKILNTPLEELYYKS